MIVYSRCDHFPLSVSNTAAAVRQAAAPWPTSPAAGQEARLCSEAVKSKPKPNSGVTCSGRESTSGGQQSATFPLPVLPSSFSLLLLLQPKLREISLEGGVIIIHCKYKSGGRETRDTLLATSGQKGYFMFLFFLCWPLINLSSFVFWLSVTLWKRLFFRSANLK